VRRDALDLVRRSDIIKVSLVQSGFFLTGASAYALYAGDPSAIGITSYGLGRAVAYALGLFVIFAPLVSVPIFLGVRNKLEEVLSSRLTTTDVLWVSLLVSCGEEMFFRGFLLRVVGVVPSAVLFGAMHYIGYESLLEVGYALFMGLVIGYLYRYLVPNILFPIVFHFSLNVFSLLMVRHFAERGK